MTFEDALNAARKLTGLAPMSQAFSEGWNALEDALIALPLAEAEAMEARAVAHKQEPDAAMIILGALPHI